MLMYTLQQIAKILGVTRQALYLQKKFGNLRPVIVKGRQMITIDELARYKAAKYSREKHFTNGYISSKKAASLCGTNLQRIYYLLYNHKLEGKRIGGMWYIKATDLDHCNVFGPVKKRESNAGKISHPAKNRVRVKRLRTLDKKGSAKEKAKKNHKPVYVKFARYPALPCKANANSPSRP